MGYVYKIVVTGDRHYRLTDIDKIWAGIRMIAKTIFGGQKYRLAFGDAKGVDAFALEFAKKNNIKYKCYKAYWKKYGLAAGPRRNIRMIDKEKPDVVLGFHSNYDKSKGTKQCLNYSKKKGAFTILVM